ncbi:unnamed protein product [Symbiodinium sp. CCMP2592]|nr:unnamed protein product [Symbiodinium sp. CCMP2592]
MTVAYLDPAACLYHAVDSCTKFGAFVQDIVRTREPSINRRWHIVLYSDEVAPGNQLKPVNSRKLQTFYWSFREFGASLCQEDAWMVLTTVRSDTVNKFKDGFTQLAKHAMLSFAAPHGNFRLGLSMGRFVMCAELATVVSDESALKHTFENKGAGGKMLCLLCRNTVQRRYASLPLHPSLVLHTCTDFSKFKLHTLNSVTASIRHLADKVGTSTKKEFEELQTNLGFNYCPEGVLSCPELLEVFDPTRGAMYDWAHVYLVSGLFHLEMNLLMAKLVQAGVTHEQIQRGLLEYSLPSHFASFAAFVKNCFVKKKGSEWDFKSSASEALTIYPMLRDILANLRPSLSEDARNAIRCFLLLCTCVDLVQKSLSERVEPADLRRAIQSHLVAFLQVYPEERFIPKGHLAMHLPAQLEHHGLLISCLTHERRHKELKRFANNLTNARPGTERGLLQELMLTHLESLERVPLGFGTELHAPKPASIALQRAFASFFGLVEAKGLTMGSKARVPKVPAVATGDIIIVKEPQAVAEVLYHCQYNDHVLTCITLYERGAKPNQFKEVHDNCTFVNPDVIIGACFTRRSDDGFVHVVPQHFAL